jgi:hypothetical protein
MLLTEEVIDSLHHFRLAMMTRLVKALQSRGYPADGREIGSGYASYPGFGSSLAQAYGVGRGDAEFDLSELDGFYTDRADNWELIVTPFDSPRVLQDAIKIGYSPDHFETVLAMTVGPQHQDAAPDFEIEECKGDLQDWIRACDSAWTERTDLTDETSEIMQISTANSARRYLARVNGEPAATAALLEIDGRYLFAGAATRPQYRGRGLQGALTQRRLADAGEGAFVQVVALPGSQSHRNLQRTGFQPLYSKLVLLRRG